MTIGEVKTVENKSNLMNIMLISVGWLATMCAMFTWFSVLAIYLGSFGLDEYYISIVYVFLQFFNAIPQILGGSLYNRFGSKKIIVATTLVSGAAFVAAGISNSFIVISVSVIIASAMIAISRPIMFTLLSDSATDKNKNTAVSSFELAYMAGYLVGPFLGAVAFKDVPYGKLMLFTGIIVIFVGLLRAALLKEIDKEHDYDKKTRTGLLKSLKKEQILYIVASCCIMIILILTIQGPYISMHAEKVFNMSSAEIRLLISVGGIGAFIVSSLITYGVKRISPYKLLAAGVILCVIMLNLWSLTPGGIWRWILFVIANSSMASLQITNSCITVEMAGDKDKASFVGLVGMLSGVVAAVGPLLGGLANKVLGSQGPFAITVFFGAVILIILGVLARWKKAEAET